MSKFGYPVNNLPLTNIKNLDFYYKPLQTYCYDFVYEKFRRPENKRILKKL